ncbi:pyrroline-5-carboxylate reductase [Liquorilactobacillus capillatus]|uniref:Pyrroline-5-carboxylate reductase n=1 Tax=Liquorilactobacillus capillatus DSM 19910 TaxID=1423731 RepID=A0A0R1M411_9LACO|nr:pyrroline-5-carboxylate reductase [Liquorilactobacillus capillatus]KRL02790.1 pyrroline-5-carboxylate reductase [Liquorilactobacillus capillatus DSM 19910]
MVKIGFIGAGNMARAIINGWLATGKVAAADILIHSAHRQSYGPYAEEKGLVPVESNKEVVEQAEIVFLAVKPLVLGSVLAEIKQDVQTKKSVLVSMVSGVSLAEIQEVLGNGKVELLRIMPNVNVEINEGITALAGNPTLTDEHYHFCEDLLNTLGKTTPLAEKDFSTFVALGGSSPAFVYFFIDSLARAGVKYGLTKKQATEIAAQAVMGSAKKILVASKTPWELVDAVSSPGGTTVAGLLAMEEAGFMTSIVKAVDATIAKDQKK